MQCIVKFARKINSAAGFIAGACVCAATVLILTEIVLRSVTSYTLYITDEYTGYLMAVSSMFGLGYVEMHHGHIRMNLIDLIQTRCPGLLRALKCVAYVAAIVVSCYLAYVSYTLFAKSFVNGTRSMQISATLLWIPQIFLPIGCLLLILQYICNFYCFLAGSSDK